MFNKVFKRHASEQPGPAEQLATGFLSHSGPTKAQLDTFRGAVGWQNDATGRAAKVNYHAQRMVWRHIKTHADTETKRQLAHNRLLDALPAPAHFKHERRCAKEALRNEDALMARIAELEGQLGEMQQQRDVYESRQRTLSDALKPFMLGNIPEDAQSIEAPTAAALAFPPRPQPQSPRAAQPRARPASMRLPPRAEPVAPQFTQEVSAVQVEARPSMQVLRSRRESSVL